MTHRTSLRIVNRLDDLVQVRAAVEASIVSGGFPAEQLNRILIAVDEAVTNIIEHGYDGSGPGTRHVDIELEVSAQEFRIALIDEGESFDPRSMSDIDIQKHVAAGRNGGLGVFLIRKIMDVVDYHHETGRHNRLVMVKKA